MGDSDNTYFTDRQHSFRFCVPPGQYMIVPSTYKEGVESDFMIRVFSPCPLTRRRLVQSRRTFYYLALLDVKRRSVVTNQTKHCEHSNVHVVKCVAYLLYTYAKTYAVLKHFMFLFLWEFYAALFSRIFHIYSNEQQVRRKASIAKCKAP